MSRRRPIVAALAAAAVLLSGCGYKGLYSATWLPGGADLGNHPFTVTAYFADVLDLVPQSAVKVNDVAIGKVDAISLTNCAESGQPHKRWCAKVKMLVNGTVDLPANARAEVQQTSLLGEKYVALLAPSGQPSTARLRDGAQIPFDDTSSAPEVEQVLGALSLVLNEGGLAQIQDIARELNKALGSTQRQKALRDLLGQLNTFLGTLDQQKDTITAALDQINTLAATLNRQKKVLTDALDTFPAALSVLNQERGKLVTLLSSLSNLGSVAGRVIDATQQDLVSSLKSLDPVVTRLAAAGSNFPKSLKILGTFPFPVGVTRQLVKGDYANLDAVLNLSLTDQLCGILGRNLPSALGQLICNLPGGQKGGNSAAATKITPASPNAPNSLPPMLIGAGR
jgi:phospholipid/cholesterol/gamma-HCH transport system substrate-binding protein